MNTGRDHLRSLQDDRAVFIDGARVADVTTHPAFQRSAASLYDVQAAPANLDKMTFASPANGRQENRPAERTQVERLADANRAD